VKSYALSLTKLSQKDIYLSEAFYEEQSQNLGTYFYNSIISDLDTLKFYAGIHAKYFGFYRMLTKRFPYAIYYEIKDEIVIVHAVLHTRKDFKAIKDRLA